MMEICTWNKDRTLHVCEFLSLCIVFVTLHAGLIAYHVLVHSFGIIKHRRSRGSHLGWA